MWLRVSLTHHNAMIRQEMGQLIVPVMFCCHGYQPDQIVTGCQIAFELSHIREHTVLFRLGALECLIR